MCKAKVDLGFLVDASGSIEMYGKGNYQRIKDFVKLVAGSFVISRRGTHVGVVVFSNRPQPVFQFNTYYTRRGVMRAVQKIPYIRGGTRTGLAIRRARRYLFESQPHPGQKKVLIVLTDGISYDDVIVPARRLRRTGVSIYALGLGLKYSRRQLLKIAGTPRHVFTSKFADLNTAARKIVRRICSGRKGYVSLIGLSPFCLRFSVVRPSHNFKLKQKKRCGEVSDTCSVKHFFVTFDLKFNIGFARTCFHLQLQPHSKRHHFPQEKLSVFVGRKYVCTNFRFVSARCH